MQLRHLIFIVLSMDVLRKDFPLQNCNYLLSACLMPVYKIILNTISFIP